MIRLKFDTSERWLDLSVVTGKDAAGKDVTAAVRVKVLPRDSIMDSAAATVAARRIRGEMEEADASADAGMPLDPAGFNAKNTDVVNAKFAQYQIEALAQFAILQWEGIAGEDGKPLPVTPETTIAFASVPALSKAFVEAYTASAVVLAAEGNVSSNTSSGDTADTARLASDALADPAQAPVPGDPGAQPAP